MVVDCSNVMTIPQFGGTCWFNAILMAVLYSQNSRKILLNICDTWDTKNKFLMICREILLKYYKYSREAVVFFNKFKPEVILFHMLNNFKDERIKRKIKKAIREKGYDEIGGNTHYITNVYKNLGVKCLDITYLKDSNKYLINLYKFFKYLMIAENGDFYIDDETIKSLKRSKEIEEIKEILYGDGPDVLIFHSSDVYNSIIESCYKDVKKCNVRLGHVYNASNKEYGILENIDGLKEHRDIITFNERKYKLESCLLSSYNTNDSSSSIRHAAVGLQCNNFKYVYNGWDTKETYLEKEKFIDEDIYIACNLIPYPWDLNYDDEICFTQKSCDLVKDKKDDCIFNFYRSKNKTLVYIRVNDEQPIENKDSEKDDMSSSRSSDSKEKVYEILPFSTPRFLEIIKDIHDIKEITDEEQLNTLIKEFDRKFKVDRTLSIKKLQEILYKEIKKYFKIANDDLLRSPEIEESRKTKRTSPSSKIDELRGKRTRTGGKSLFSKRILKKYNK